MKISKKLLKKSTLEVEKAIRSLGSKKSEKNEHLHCYSIRVPEVRKRHKKGYSFSSMDQEDQIFVWDYIWKHSTCYEAMSQSLYQYQGKTLSLTESKIILTWAGRITCWEHSDDLSKIYAQVVEDRPNFLLGHLRKWNKAKDPWKRRQSVVSLLEYSSKRKKVLPFEKLISFVEKLLGDDEYYVQKGVGWTLREIYNVYPTETLRFLEKNLSKISSIAYSPATEKLDKAKKKRLNDKRKLERLK